MDGEKKDSFFSVVPEGTPHRIVGEREVMLPGIALEILTTRKIRLTRWELDQLNDPYWRLYCPVGGSASVQFNDNEDSLELTPGNLYLIPPRTTISSSNPHTFTKWYVHFVLGGSDFNSVPGVYELPVDPAAESMLSSLESLTGTESYTWEPASLVIHALSQLPAEAWTDKKLDRRVVKAMEFLQANLSKKVTADDAARAAGVSVRNLNHLFRSQLRMAPMSVLLNYRLDLACRMLRHTDYSIEHIAESCGFPNRYYFSRMLKQARNVSPAAYRKGQLY